MLLFVILGLIGLTTLLLGLRRRKSTEETVTPEPVTLAQPLPYVATGYGRSVAMPVKSESTSEEEGSNGIATLMALGILSNSGSNSEIDLPSPSTPEFTGDDGAFGGAGASSSWDDNSSSSSDSSDSDSYSSSSDSDYSSSDSGYDSGGSDFGGGGDFGSGD